MSKNGIFVCLFFAAVGIAPLAEGTSPPLALDSLIALALERNPDLQAVEHRRLAAVDYADQAGSWPDPQMSLGFLNLPRSSLAMGETPMSAVSLGLTQQVPWPGKLSPKSELAELTTQSRALDRAIREDQIVRQVTEQYYELAYWQRTKEILRENIVLLDAISEIARTHYANGKGSAQDVLRSETARARLDNRILMTDSRRVSALSALGWLIDDPRIATSPLSAYIPEISLGSTLLAISSPALSRADVEASMAEKQVALARQGYWPDLSFGIDYKIRSERAMDPVNGEDFLSFKVGLRLPLWSFGRQKHQTSAARWNLAAARAGEQSLATKLSQRAFDLHQAMESTAIRASQYDREILPNARAARDAAQVAYEVGRVDFDALLMSQLDLMNIRLERLELLKQYYQQAAALAELTAGNKEME